MTPNKQQLLKDIRPDDFTRSEAFADYVLRILLRLPPRKDKEKRDLGHKSIAVLLAGYDAEHDRHPAESWGKAFEDGANNMPFSQLATILGNLRRVIKHNIGVPRKKGKDVHIRDVPVPSSAQLLEALQIATRLNPAERDALGLPKYSQHPLLQQAMINLATMSVSEGHQVPEAYQEVYQRSLQVNQSSAKPLTSLEDLTTHLKEHFEGKSETELKDLAAHLQNRFEEKSDAEKIRQTIEDVLKRLLLQAGTGQARFLTLNDQDQYIRNYIDTRFLDNLRETVLHNDKLRAQFPIHLKKITIEPYGPFPFQKLSDNPETSFLSKTLLKPSGKNKGSVHAPIDEQFDQLPTRNVMQVTGHFYICIDDPTKIKDGKDYQGFDRDTFNRLSSLIDGKLYLHFKVSTTGIGGTGSLISKVLNKALLSDVKCLQKTYFPIAHDLVVTQKNVHQRVLSQVENHSFVQLCTRRTIQRALLASSKEGDKESHICQYEEFSDHDVRGAGNYSDFDMLMSAANAGLLARIQAIANTDVNPDTYIFDVVARVEQQHLFDKAVNHLIAYPFSSYAMKSRFQADLFEKAKARQREDSLVVYNAHLLISEIFITEGSYRNAYPCLKILRKELAEDSQQGIDWLKGYDTRQPMTYEDMIAAEAKGESKIRVVSGQILARYELCLARYLMVLDREEENKNYFLELREDATQKDLVEAAWKHLDRAEQHLTIRVIKYHVIDEVSQATFQPYYRLLSQIYSFRAKLFLYYPSIVAPEKADYSPPTQNIDIQKNDPRHAAANRLYLMERARVFAACHGGIIRYTNFTAYQCRFWLMTAFSTAAGTEAVPFDKPTCLQWAEQLRNHALLHYSETGQRCYHAIKEKSGLEDTLKYQDYGRHQVQSICAIRETMNRLPRYENNDGQEVLFLDMKNLAIKRGNVDRNNTKSLQSIYLFGPEACHLFFIRGLYHLCSDEVEEFPDLEMSKEERQEARSRGLSIENWKAKLAQCTLSFNYAWAIAGDGCGIQHPDAGDPNLGKTKHRITRDMNEVPACTSDPHVKSVWNLYPYRVNEIADLGKMFAAACAALRCYTEVNIETQRSEMKALLDSLPGGANYKLTDELVRSMEGQHRFNGHLVGYFQQCSEVIREVAEKAESGASEKKVLQQRNELMNKLFSLNALK